MPFLPDLLQSYQGEVNHGVLPVHAGHSLHSVPLTFKAGRARSSRTIYYNSRYL